MSQTALPLWIVAAVLLILQSKVVELYNETFVITAYERLEELYIDSQPQSLINIDNWNLTDNIILQSTNRLIAVYAVNLGHEQCSGVLASVYDGSFLTNNDWKCLPYEVPGWAILGFNDSSWPNAVEHGSNGNHINCSQQEQFIEDINENSKWIWTKRLGDFTAYCRGYLHYCETSSPCLNNGTCLKNDERFCDCLPQFTGTYCETEIPTTTETTESFTTELTTEFTTEETNVSFTSDDSTLFTTANDLSTTSVETSEPADTTHGLSTNYIQTTETLETTVYLSTDNTETTHLDETTVYFSTDNTVTTQPPVTTEYLTTSNLETTHSSETTYLDKTTEYFSTDNTVTTQPPVSTEYLPTTNLETTQAGETTDLDETSEYFSTDNTVTTQPPVTTEYLPTSNLETTQAGETTDLHATTEYFSTDNTVTTQPPVTTEYLPTSNLETTQADERSTESEEAATSKDMSSESVTSQIVLQTTATASTAVSDLETTTDDIDTVPTTAQQTSGSSNPTIAPASSQDVDFTKFTTSTWFNETGNFSTPLTYGICPEELYCDGPWENGPDSSIAHCDCPSGYLDLSSNCCLSQNWIIVLTCVSAGILIGIIITIVACIRHRRHHHDDSDAISLSNLSSISLEGSLPNGKALAATESSLLTEVTERPSADNSGYIDPPYRDVKVETAMPFSDEKLHAMPSAESHMAITEWDPVLEEEQARQDCIYNPLMVDLVSSESYRQFRPSLASVATDVDYTIQRPSIQQPIYDNSYNQDFQSWH